MAKKFSSMHQMGSETNDVVETYGSILPNINNILQELTTLLEIDDGLQSEIVKNLIKHGRQVLISYEDNIIGEIYDEQMKENSRLLALLKDYHRQQWTTEYCNKFSWFCSLIEECEATTKELYDRVLTRTAEYGDKYMNDCPLLSIVIQILFESLSDDDMSTTFDNIWSSLTYDGLQSITQHSDYIVLEIMNKQLEISLEKKLYGPLFMALREYYRNELVRILKQCQVLDRNNLYELALDFVAEHGWLDGIKLIEKKTTKKNFDVLMDLVKKIQKSTAIPESAPTLVLTLAPTPIPTSTPIMVPTPVSISVQTPISAPIPTLASTLVPTPSFGNVTLDEKETKELYLEDLRRDLANMPSCAEKCTMKLLVHFEDKLAESQMSSQEDDSVVPLLQELKNQIKKQELFSGKIQENVQNLERYVFNNDVPSTVRSLRELLTKIRPLNVPEIQRLVNKTKVAGELIHGKEIILLIGETGTGKSTTIQFLAGCKMKRTQVQVEHGRFLEHITVDGPVTNAGLKNVTSSARNKSETRYIAPVTIQLKDIFGSYKCGEIILCDAPGFGDTAGPEIDIANSVGVIKAIKGCKSVKILALSSYKSLGDRGQGIQKLAHLLINMVHGIQERLNAILYAFTKYPPNIDISATLIDIKISKVDTDHVLQSDNAFVTVLTDMICRTKDSAEKIDPIHGDPKNIIGKLQNLQSIKYPEEVFRFSMSEETQACIANQVQRDSLSVKCALKHKNIDLVLYYLNNLKNLKNLLDDSTTRDAYEDAIRFIRESIMDYSTGVTEKFNRSLVSQDGLGEDDVNEYKSSVEYARHIQKLTEYLGSNLLSPESLIQNIHSELQKMSQALIEKDLYSPLVRIYFNNICLIKDCFKEFETFYNKSCNHFEERFVELVQSAHEPISVNEFNTVAEIILKVSKCLPILNKYLHGLVEEKYKEIAQFLLQHLNGFSEKADSILTRIVLSESDVEIVKNYVKILRSAKENFALEDRIFTYVEMLTKKNDKLAQNVKSLSDIYNKLIEKILNYFNQINNKISELFQTSGDRALEEVETLVNDMDRIRTIPEIESKSAGAYYHTVESIRGHMHQLQRDVEQLLFSIDHHSGTPNYAKIARLLSRLRNAKWMNRVSPGAYDVRIHRVTEELVQYFHDLEDRLMKLDLNLKYPENVSVAKEIFDTIDSLSVLERIVPELKKSKDDMIERFLDSIQGNFNRLQEKFNLQDNSVYQMKQELKELEQIKREYDNSQPARVFLRNHDFSDINKLNDEIDDLENKQKIELEQENEKNSKIETELNNLKPMTQEYDHLHHSKLDQDESKKNQTYQSKSVRYSNIDIERKTIIKTQEHNDQLEIIQKNNNTLSSLKSIKKQYEILLDTHDSPSPEQINLLHEKQKDNIELLIEIIEKKKKVIGERQKNKQSYDFNNRFDASTADIALLYTSNCQKIGNVRLKEIAADTHEILTKYISEYGFFLDQEIGRLFTHLTNIDSQEDLSQYSQDLETRLDQLTSLTEFKHVFGCIEGTKKVDYWRRKFSEQYRTMSSSMEDYKVSGRNQDLKNQLTIAQGLMGSDHFCSATLLSNGFGALYRQYRIEAAREAQKAYENVINCISEEDYAKVDMVLADIEEKTPSPREIAKIKYSLQINLKRLMQNTRSIGMGLDQKIKLRENNQSQIEKIYQNIEKIQTILSKPRIMKLVDETIESDLIKFERDIPRIFSDVLLKRLSIIEDFINSDDIFEAEQEMEHFNRVQYELTNFFMMENVNEKVNEINKRLENLANDISKQNDFKNIENYHKKSPRHLLAKLNKAALYRPAKYAEVCTSISKEIQHNFEIAITKTCESSIEERSAQILSLNNTLNCLPESLKESFKPKIDKLRNQFAEEERVYKYDLKEFLENEIPDDRTIAKIGVLAQEYSQNKQSELFNMLRSEIIKKLCNYQTKIQNSLDNQDMKSAVEYMRHIVKYKENIHHISDTSARQKPKFERFIPKLISEVNRIWGENVQSAPKPSNLFPSLVTLIPEIDEIYRSVCTLTRESFARCSQILINIFKFEDTQIVDKAFHNMIIYIEFSQSFHNRIKELLPDSLLQQSQSDLKMMHTSWNKNFETYRNAIDTMNINLLYEIMIPSKLWDEFLRKIRQCACQHKLIQDFLDDMKTIPSYTYMKSELETKIIYFRKQFDIELVTDETKLFEAMRDQFFSNLAMSLKTLKSINSKFKDILVLEIDIEILEKKLKDKVEDIKKKLLAYALKEQISSSEADYFRMYYNHLVSFDKYLRFPEANIRNTLELAEETILDRVTSLSKGITSLGSDVTKVVELLVKMKFFAENFSMFDTKINEIIDEALKSYKTEHGFLILSQLTMILEKSDVGSRVIGEHSCFRQEDWRIRREKMQKQDDLDYVIGKLKGDDLDKDILRKRHETFRTMYDDLISNTLQSFNSKTGSEPNLEILISQTKVLIGKVNHKTADTAWNQSFRDMIPELLAHIFAVWTLKNTQNYNAMRGIDERNAYLLMPHVAQIIAIFRILGIGYKTSSTFVDDKVPLTKRISNSLVNNLVQIGTGEGKSVVMAVTACVFALIGVDVDCSCYSEYLSMRDKNDFAPIFQVLGIDERIQYGTFNKLCENFLNEQCNVRENVRDMIMNNRNVIDIVETTARIRPKVLLIDEVDVFLSEKFYGGMYIPSVYLKDSLINNLLDALWQNRNLRTLNAVKTLPAYKNCAARFSNWMFLFDEAIKDMIAALKSFQSSTYIVQNDKIVYVEGESIAENVVRGYDTIWAYYFENQKGFISEQSLKTNVGIIINCGTFSYAEMPHEFAYITGVTGTLQTLAQPEKNILKTVYEIQKNTYMPSVFGESNRNYNSANDVEAVKKSEYFMRIRGEIDTMRNAQRAILVFFESEEKLIIFYNSKELSSIKQEVQIITEKVSTKERELCIKRAATNGRVTLLTRTFGRGTDFICRNQQVLANGGIHVLQTFFSEELSEEYQIMGRGARQGDRGSFRMILLDSDLEWVIGADWEKDIPKITGSTLYTALDKDRNKLYETKCAAKEVSIEQCRREHQAFKTFMDALSKGKMDIVKNFLIEQNRGANIDSGISRTLLLMDATGSMSSLLSTVKDTVCTMFERASAILVEKGLPNDAFQMQFAVYRDYDCGEDGLLQSSSWETKPNNLRSFMTEITAKGGGDYEEAIEIGLWHAVEQSEQPDGLSQVILIGDAPAKEKFAIARDRQTKGGESYWSKTKFSNQTYYIDELKKLKDKNIPVHAFYLAHGAKDNFQKIASEKTERCQRLKLNSSQGAEQLTNFITEEVLRKTAGDQGDAVVEMYRAKYVKSTFTS